MFAGPPLRTDFGGIPIGAAVCTGQTRGETDVMFDSLFQSIRGFATMHCVVSEQGLSK